MSAKTSKVAFRVEPRRIEVYEAAYQVRKLLNPDLKEADWFRYACDAQAARDLNPKNGARKNAAVAGLEFDPGRCESAQQYYPPVLDSETE